MRLPKNASLCGISHNSPFFFGLARTSNKNLYLYSQNSVLQIFLENVYGLYLYKENYQA